MSPTTSVWIEPSHDRMPVLPEMTDFDGWLDGWLGLEALKPAPEGALHRLVDHIATLLLV